MSKEIIQSFPSDWGLGLSDNGWMDTKNFVLYITKVLYPFLIKKGVKFPVIYFVDGHKSHTALEAADACKRLGIILIALFPNATRILQPADVGVFKPLKTRWFQVVETWKTDNKFAAVTLTKFGSLLKKAMDLALTTNTIIHAFAACGLYPFNPNAVDYSKCIAEAYQDSYDDPEPPDTVMNDDVDPVQPDLMVPYHIVEESLVMLGSEKIRSYNNEQYDHVSHEDRVLAFVYKNILCRSNNALNATDYAQVAEISVDDPMFIGECKLQI